MNHGAGTADASPGQENDTVASLGTDPPVVARTRIREARA
jgi:hypothetical protein